MGSYYGIDMILLNKFCIQRTSTMEQWSGVKKYDLQMWVIIMVLLWYCYEIFMILLNKICIQRTSTMEQWSESMIYKRG